MRQTLLLVSKKWAAVLWEVHLAKAWGCPLGAEEDPVTLRQENRDLSPTARNDF